ncbi:hypothetical protein [Pseudomonas sp. 58 R 12]|uniref:hypothetical protein n=1 Tax=Pseudomonas sp. 58 R 12 TaxID=1844107 RepID=UPI000812872B|nr:hypothetical protein [Pseudomonas sp. 58 R 12]CRM50520.1 hypothetical protein [Pseudomonas sp. 58 R 12]
MARRRNRESQPGTASKPDDFGLFKKARLAVISATGGVFLGAYTSLITGYVGPFLTSMVEWTQDHLLPMPADQQIVAEAHFFVAKKSGVPRSGELMGVALRGIDCLKPGGASDYKLYEFGDEVVYTNALLHATCRPSGKTKITITPRNGNPVVLFNGFIKGREQVEIGGVEGSYEYGMLTVSYVGTKEPNGPHLPVNQTPPPLPQNRK